MRLNIFRVKVFQRIESSVVIDLRLRIAVSVQHHHRGNACCGCDFLVVSTECRGNVDNTCRAFVRGDVVAGDYPERVAFKRLEPRNQLVISYACEL